VFKNSILLRRRSDRSSPKHGQAAVFGAGKFRVVQPEILDRLPENSTAARASRRDLLVINRLLGSSAWFKKILRTRCLPSDQVLEVGAGTGELGRTLTRITPVLAGLDLGRRPPYWPVHAQWFETDVFAFGRWADYSIVIGNLFFHHFDRGGLAQLGARLGEHARVVIASEPLRRHRTAMLFPLICPLIQAHPVTRYDGRVSIAAGFRGEELPLQLQLDPAVWSWQVKETLFGSSRMVAWRRV